MLVGLFAGIILILSYKYHINYKEDITLNLSYEYELAVNKYNNGDNEYLSTIVPPNSKIQQRIIYKINI